MPSSPSLQMLICCKEESVSSSPDIFLHHFSSLQCPQDTIFLGSSSNSPWQMVAKYPIPASPVSRGVSHRVVDCGV